MRARSIIANSLKILFAASTCLLFTACPKKDQPSPADTLMGPTTPTRPDYIQGDAAGNYPGGGAGGSFNPDGSLMPADGDPSLEGRFGANGGVPDPTGGIRNLVPSVYFDYDQSFIRQDQRTALTETIAYLEENSSVTILVEGHCDFKGTTEYNLALGDRRAGSVRDYLIDSGIDASRVSVVSKGDLEATADGSDSQRAEDRRADIVIYQ